MNFGCRKIIHHQGWRLAVWGENYQSFQNESNKYCSLRFAQLFYSDEKSFLRNATVNHRKLAEKHKFLVNRIHKFSSSARHRPFWFISQHQHELNGKAAITMFESRSQIYIERKRNVVNVQRYECKAYLLLWTSEKKVIGKNRDRDRKEDQHNGKSTKKRTNIRN